jgi:hypothetical protein
MINTSYILPMEEGVTFPETESVLPVVLSNWKLFGETMEIQTEHKVIGICLNRQM